MKILRRFPRMDKEPAPSFAFFNLPKEIRDQIMLDYAGNKDVTSLKIVQLPWPRKRNEKGEPCRDNHTIFFDSHSLFHHIKSGRWNPHCFHTVPDLLSSYMVSRQFYQEAAMAFYSSSMFWFQEDFLPFSRLLNALPMSHQNRIRVLEFDINVTSREEVERWRLALEENVASHFPSLREVVICMKINRLPFEVHGNMELTLSCSRSLPMLEKALVSMRWVLRLGKWGCSEEEAHQLVRRMADALR